jgi:hypothetical protein
MIVSELGRAKAYREIAAVEAGRGEIEKARLWVNSLTSPLEKSSGLLGLADGLLQPGGLAPSTPCESRHLAKPKRNHPPETCRETEKPGIEKIHGGR